MNVVFVVSCVFIIVVVLIKSCNTVCIEHTWGYIIDQEDYNNHCNPRLCHSLDSRSLYTTSWGSVDNIVTLELTAGFNQAQNCLGVLDSKALLLWEELLCTDHDLWPLCEGGIISSSHPSNCKTGECYKTEWQKGTGLDFMFHVLSQLTHCCFKTFNTQLPL